MPKSNKLVRSNKEEDKLDMYRAHYLENKPLEERFQEYLDKMIRAKTMLTSGLSMSNAAKMLQKEFDIKHAQSYNVIRDSLDLFGDITKASKEGMRYILYENFMNAANLALRNNDHSSMVRALEAAAKLYGLFDQTPDEIDAGAFAFPAQFIFSDNVNILNQGKQDED